MDNYLNILEVDKLPLNEIDRFIGIDVDGNIKTASVVVDEFLDDTSDNAVSNKAVAIAIGEMRSTIGEIDTVLLEILG